jgi:ribosomal protein L11 methyltransferase
MNYIETKIYTTTAGAEAVLALLLRFGIYSVSVEDSADLRTIIDAKDWLGWDYIADELTAGEESGEVAVSFYTENTDEGAAMLSEIKTALMALKGEEQYGSYGTGADFGRLYAESEPLSDEWKEKLQEAYVPFRAAEHIVIVPDSFSSEGVPGAVAVDGDIAVAGAGDEVARPGDTIVRIQQGMAFGTGTHETTAMCLSEIERRVRPGMSLLDIGAGTGILSIAAALRGAAPVTAVEYDEDAADTAAVNIEINGIGNAVGLVRGDIIELLATLGSYDIIVCNLVSGIIGKIAADIRLHLKEGGMFIASGLLIEEEAAVISALSGAGFTIDKVHYRGEWLSLCAYVS